MIIYKSTNKITGKIYIGQTTQTLENRIKNHVKESDKNKKRPFLLSLKKYGIENFIFEVIDCANNLDELNDKEIYWIDYYKSTTPNGYNITGGGQGKKMIRTEELTKRISKGLINSEKWQKIKNSQEFKDKMVKNFYGSNKGKKFSKEHKEKIWGKNKQRVLDFNKTTAKKWIVVNENNNIIRLTGKEEYFNSIGLDTGNISRMANKLNKNKIIKRYYGYYCFIDNNQTDEEILCIVNNLDSHYFNEITIHNKKTNETLIMKKNEIYSFCLKENYDYSSFLRMTKGHFKSYKNWTVE